MLVRYYTAVVLKRHERVNAFNLVDDVMLPVCLNKVLIEARVLYMAASIEQRSNGHIQCPVNIGAAAVAVKYN